ncbi:hypothetical protein AMECASPLE_011541 [Ameca splendens]|uniref:Uncharacterized protein n=1 Tax=Ameca splendens TaxID=208324 RepID=A0ABV0ZAK2_9TELE
MDAVREIPTPLDENKTELRSKCKVYKVQMLGMLTASATIGDRMGRRLGLRDLLRGTVIGRVALCPGSPSSSFPGSVRVYGAEDPGMQMSRQHDGY